MSSLIGVKTFATRPEAELAKSILKAGGVRAVVPFDDAGVGNARSSGSAVESVSWSTLRKRIEPGSSCPPRTRERC